MALSMRKKETEFVYKRLHLVCFCITVVRAAIPTTLGQSNPIHSTILFSSSSSFVETTSESQLLPTLIPFLAKYQKKELVGEVVTQDKATSSSTKSNLESSSAGEESSSITTSASISSSSSNRLSLLSATSTATAISSPSTLVPASYSLPQAFDSTLNTAFISTSCPSFFYTFLADPKFMQCAPFSLLLSTSTAFFDAQKSPDSILPYVLSASCSAPSTCSALMDSLSNEIVQASNCKQDLAAGNSLVNQALTGFNNYDIMRAASCQKDNSTGLFCFTEASSSSANSRSSISFYYIPLGTLFPSKAIPVCDSCTKGLVSIYSGFANDPSLLISKTYLSASVAVSQTCGPSFVPFTPTTQSHTSDTSRLLAATRGIILLVGVVLLYYWSVVRAGDILAGKVKVPEEAASLMKVLNDAETGDAQRLQGLKFEFEEDLGEIADTINLEEGEILKLSPTPTMCMNEAIEEVRAKAEPVRIKSWWG